MDKNQILDQPKQINYPGFNRDIVSFGMVKDVVIDQALSQLFLLFLPQMKKKRINWFRKYLIILK